MVRPSYVLGGRAMVVADDRTRRAVHAPRSRDPPVPRADRPLPGTRHRSRCGRPLRWRGFVYRRRDAAHRGSRHPLGRQRVLRPIPPHICVSIERRIEDACHDRARRQGPDERAARGQEQRALHPRDQPARLPDRPLLSARPRACLSRSLPRRSLGKTIKDLASRNGLPKLHISVKEAVLPFNRFAGVDSSSARR